MRFLVHFFNLRHRWPGLAWPPHVEKLLKTSELGVVAVVEAPSQEPIAEIIDKAVGELQQRLSVLTDDDLAPAMIHLRAILEPYCADAVVDRDAIVRWLTDPRSAKCTYREANGTERVIPAAIGPTEYTLSEDRSASPQKSIAEPKQRQTARTLWAIDSYRENLGSLNMRDDALIDLSVKPHEGVNVALMNPASSGDSYRWALLSAWGPSALGASFLAELVPRLVWDTFNDDERWILEEAAALVTAEALPLAPWLRDSTPVTTAWEAWRRGDAKSDAREKALSVLGIEYRAGDPAPLLSDLADLGTHRQRRIYNSAKRLLGLVEYRIRRTRITCRGHACINYQNRASGTDKNTGQPRRCDDTPKLWLGDALHISDKDTYDRAWKRWQDRLRFNSQIPESLGVILHAAGAAMPCCPIAVGNMDARAWYDQIQKVRESAQAGNGAPVGVELLGALGQAMIQVRNLLEHSPAITSSDRVTLDTRAAERAWKELGISVANAAEANVVITTSDVAACLRLAVLFLIGWHSHPELAQRLTKHGH